MFDISNFEDYVFFAYEIVNFFYRINNTFLSSVCLSVLVFTSFMSVCALWKKNVGILWAVYYTSPQSFLVFLFVGLTTLGTLVNFDWLSV